KICFFSPSLNQHIFAAELGYIDKEQKIDFFKCYQQLFEIPMLKYNRLKKTRFWKDARSILAADLIKICYAMYRDNSAFDPNKIY
ncbi:MAG: hypothetical protein AB1349_11635, partial [Elusimicrobiota bacterium]